MSSRRRGSDGAKHWRTNGHDEQRSEELRRQQRSLPAAKVGTHHERPEEGHRPPQCSDRQIRQSLVDNPERLGSAPARRVLCSCRPRTASWLRQCRPARPSIGTALLTRAVSAGPDSERGPAAAGHPERWALAKLDGCDVGIDDPLRGVTAPLKTYRAWPYPPTQARR